MGDRAGSGWRDDAEDMLAAAQVTHGLATRGSSTQTKWVVLLVVATVLYVAGFTGLGLLLAHPLNGILTLITLGPTLILGWIYLGNKFSKSVFDISELTKVFFKGMMISIPGFLVEFGLLLLVMTYVFTSPAAAPSASGSGVSSGGSSSASAASASTSVAPHLLFAQQQQQHTILGADVLLASSAALSSSLTAAALPAAASVPPAASITPAETKTPAAAPATATPAASASSSGKPTATPNAASATPTAAAPSHAAPSQSGAPGEPDAHQGGSAIVENSKAQAQEDYHWDVQVIFGFLFAYLIASLISEVLKYLMIVSGNRLFREPYEVVVYGASMALGYGMMENALTVMFAGLDPKFPFENRFALAAVRGVLNVPMHLLTGMWMSVSVARRTFYYDSVRMVQCIAMPVFLHGTFDFMLIALLRTRYQPFALVGCAFLNLIGFTLFHLRKLASLQETVPPEIVF
eukprot:comp18549_c0_seq1/m.33360 comp18549_c0_seq1/g.33360  ORF comp18549_c0_seq1/g.33360 comp18549_c0_seq1/m.33360 type:complete len:463 (+) comp18549_c0_seq1:167-1555(+)